MLQSLEQAEHVMGEVPEELKNLPTLPPCADYIWELYHKLSSTRTCGMSINPISYSEIYYYTKLAGIKLSEWEIDAIISIDYSFLSIHNEA